MTNTHLADIDRLLAAYERIYNGCHAKQFIIRRTDNPHISGSSQYRNDDPLSSVVIRVGTPFINRLVNWFASREYAQLFIRNGINPDQMSDIRYDSLIASVSYVIGHEISHAKRGHLRYLADRNGVVDDTTRMRLEIDADAISARSSLLFQIKENWFKTKLPAFLACLTVPIILASLDKGLKIAKYPTSSVRLHVFEMGMASWLHEIDYFDGHNNRIREMFAQSQALARHFCTTQGLPFDFFDEMESVDAWWKEHFLEMHDFTKPIYDASDFQEDERADLPASYRLGQMTTGDKRDGHHG